MKPEILWMVLIKVFGIWLILQGLGIVPQFMSTIIALHDQTGHQHVLTILLVSVFSLAMYGFVIWAFLCRTEAVIKLFRLERGLSGETIDLNIHRSVVLKIIVVVTGGLIVIDSLPELVRSTVTFLQYKAFFLENPRFGLFAFFFVKFLVGLFLMLNSRLVVAIIERLRLK